MNNVNNTSVSLVFLLDNRKTEFPMGKLYHVDEQTIESLRERIDNDLMNMIPAYIQDQEDSIGYFTFNYRVRDNIQLRMPMPDSDEEKETLIRKCFYVYYDQANDRFFIGE